MALTVAAYPGRFPLTIADVGLWLTFGATAAIIAGASRVTLPRHWWLRAPLALVLASIAAELSCCRSARSCFSGSRRRASSVNLVAVPCMAIVQIAAMVTAAADAAASTSVADAAGWVTYAGVRGLIDSAASRRLRAVADVASALASVARHGLLRSRHVWFLTRSTLVRGRVRSRRPSLIWIAVAPATLARVSGDGRLHLTVMDVGQGDAMLVTFPNGRTLMVDTGGVVCSRRFRYRRPRSRPRASGTRARTPRLPGDHARRSRPYRRRASIVRDFHPSEIWYGVFVNNHEPITDAASDGEPAAAGVAMAAGRRPIRVRRRRDCAFITRRCRTGSARRSEMTTHW